MPMNRGSQLIMEDIRRNGVRLCESLVESMPRRTAALIRAEGGLQNINPEFSNKIDFKVFPKSLPNNVSHYKFFVMINIKHIIYFC